MSLRTIIFGNGVLGSATGAYLTYRGHYVAYHDPAKGDLVDQHDFKGFDLALICVPTPQGTDGSVDTSIVWDCLNELALNGFVGFAGIRSTVVPGTCNRYANYFKSMRLFSWPEFLIERNALAGTMHPQYSVLGMFPPEPVIINLLPDGAKKFICEPKEAEFIKYATNCLLAASVGVANELAEFAKSMNIDWNASMPAICEKDANLPKNVIVTEECGFGGKCLPKDLSAMLSLATERGFNMPVLSAVQAENNKRRN